jgi:transcriptional regulator with XRE-family HTH domain
LQVLMKTRMTALGGDGPPLSTHEVAARAGGLMSANTVSALLRGKVANPSEQTVEGLAVALETPVETVRRAVASSDGKIKITLPTRAAKLSDEAFGELLNYLDYLLQRDNGK